VRCIDGKPENQIGLAVASQKERLFSDPAESPLPVKVYRPPVFTPHPDTFVNPDNHCPISGCPKNHSCIIYHTQVQERMAELINDHLTLRG